MKLRTFAHTTTQLIGPLGAAAFEQSTRRLQTHPPVESSQEPERLCLPSQGMAGHQRSDGFPWPRPRSLCADVPGRALAARGTPRRPSYRQVVQPRLHLSSLELLLSLEIQVPIKPASFSLHLRPLISPMSPFAVHVHS